MNENLSTGEPADSYAGQLSVVDQSMGFLLLIIFATLLSFYSLTINRRQLIYSQECPEKLESLPPVFPIRLLVGAIVSGCLSFFFHLALQNSREEGLTWAERCSAQRNLVASFLVLAAALIRLFDASWNQQLLSCGQETPEALPFSEAVEEDAPPL
ncbi:MAG: hypothetical protein HFG26_10410 [Provencibacterium sp.]|jgi:hypothetical protein|nr:hypothetical protein [Provencibacterium sp.]